MRINELLVKSRRPPTLSLG